MPEYKIYSVRKDGHIARPPDVVECVNDEAAVQVAKKLLDGQLIEVWEGPRVVMRLEPK